MSGLYLPGMEMPKRCWDCLLNTYGYCMASEHSDIIPSDAPIPKWCPLGPVPEHGRLIDADKLDYSETDLLGNHIVYMVDIEDAHTIIPADKEGEL